MKIFKLSENNLDKIVGPAERILKKDGLIVLPSDTAYGLAASAKSDSAVQKIYDFKGRQFGKGISIFLNNVGEIKKYAVFSPDQEEIFKTLLPGPFTVILKSRHRTAPEIEPGDGTIGIRVVANELIQKLTANLPFPITATSANLAGKGPHYSVKSFINTLSTRKKEMINLVIDGGQLRRRPTSTVVRMVGDEVKTLRQGIFDLRLLEKQTTLGEKQTRRLSKKIYREFFAPFLKNQAVVVILKGDLGAGKTVLAKGIGSLFNLFLTSPTFVLLNEYPVNKIPLKVLYHLDLFRVKNPREIEELGLESFLKKGHLILIEWGEKLSILEKLKKQKAAFFLVQINILNSQKRQISLFKL